MLTSCSLPWTSCTPKMIGRRCWIRAMHCSHRLNFSDNIKESDANGFVHVSTFYKNDDSLIYLRKMVMLSHHKNSSSVLFNRRSRFNDLFPVIIAYSKTLKLGHSEIFLQTQTKDTAQYIAASHFIHSRCKHHNLHLLYRCCKSLARNILTSITSPSYRGGENVEALTLVSPIWMIPLNSHPTRRTRRCWSGLRIGESTLPLLSFPSLFISFHNFGDNLLSCYFDLDSSRNH